MYINYLKNKKISLEDLKLAEVLPFFFKLLIFSKKQSKKVFLQKYLIFFFKI